MIAAIAAVYIWFVIANNNNNVNYCHHFLFDCIPR